MLHWSLFVYFNHPDGLPALLELFLSPPYLATIRTSCPHLLRYLVFAVIVTHRLPSPPRVAGQKRSDPLKEVVRAIEGESYQYEDPLTQFITRLQLEFDFEGAQESLTLAAEQVIKNDFFLADTDEDGKKMESFLENARYLVSETYCKIHQRVDIKCVPPPTSSSSFCSPADPPCLSPVFRSDLSARLNLTREEGEKWIVNLIRDTRLEGKIDLNANMLHITRPFNPPSQSILAITRDIAESANTMNWAMGPSAGSADKKRSGGGDKGGRSAGARKQEGGEPAAAAQTVEVK